MTSTISGDSTWSLHVCICSQGRLDIQTKVDAKYVSQNFLPEPKEPKSDVRTISP